MNESYIYNTAGSFSGKIDADLYSFANRLDDVVSGRKSLLSRIGAAVRRAIDNAGEWLSDRLIYNRYSDDVSTRSGEFRKLWMEDRVYSGTGLLEGLWKNYGISNLDGANAKLSELRDQILDGPRAGVSRDKIMDLSKEYVSIARDCRAIEHAGRAVRIIKKFYEDRGGLVDRFISREREASVSAPDRGRQMEMMRKLESAESMGLNRTQGVKR